MRILDWKRGRASERQERRLLAAGPAALIEALEATLKNLEHEFDIGRGTIDDGECVAAERGGHVARGIAGTARLLHDNGGRGRVEPAEKLEHARAGLFALIRRSTGGGGVRGIEREAEIDNGDVDRVVADRTLGFAGGAGTQRMHTHGLEQRGQAVDPGFVLPATPGEEQVQAVVVAGFWDGLRRVVRRLIEVPIRLAADERPAISRRAGRTAVIPPTVRSTASIRQRI